MARALTLQTIVIVFPNCNLTTQSIEYGVRSVNYRNTFVTIADILNIHCKT